MVGWGNIDVIIMENMLKVYIILRFFWYIICKIIRKNIRWIFIIFNLNDINVVFKIVGKKVFVLILGVKWWWFDKNVIKYRNFIVFFFVNV